MPEYPTENDGTMEERYLWIKYQSSNFQINKVPKAAVDPIAEIIFIFIRCLKSALDGSFQTSFAHQRKYTVTGRNKNSTTRNRFNSSCNPKCSPNTRKATVNNKAESRNVPRMPNRILMVVTPSSASAWGQFYRSRRDCPLSATSQTYASGKADCLETGTGFSRYKFWQQTGSALYNPAF